MSSPQDGGSFRRPPIARNDSSSPSLFAMDRSISLFQDFVKRTPPLDQSKPLPPVPLAPRRASGGWLPQSRSPSLYNGRRASSVYSRTTSMWDEDVQSFSSADFADEPMPPLPTLQPLAYSSSTPQLGNLSNKVLPLEPRGYNPLIITPSPSVSRGRTPSPAGSAPLQIILPESPKKSNKRLQTISLEQAKRTHHAPGVIHLLPEELLAQTIKKRRSHEPLRMGSVDMFSPMTASDLPEPPTLVDQQGRRRTIGFVRGSVAGLPISAPIETASAARYVYESSFQVGDGPERQMVSLIADNPRVSNGGRHDQEERGRARERGWLISGSNKRVAAGRKPGKGVHGVDTSQNRGLMSSPLTCRSISAGYHDTDSDDSLKTRMKLVPQPLFKTKPPAKLPGAVSGHLHSNSRSPYRRGSTDGSPCNLRDSSNGNKDSIPFGLSLSFGSSHRRRSTSGSIPISPPTGMSVTPRFTPEERMTLCPLVYESEVARESAYYPFVASRKDRKQRAKPTHISTSTPPVPLLSLGMAAEKFGAPHGTPNSFASMARVESGGTDSNISSRSKRQFQRVAKSAVKYADLLIRPSKSHNTQNNNYHSHYPIPESPHLHLFPQQRQDHLGSSAKAKSAFDEAPTSITSPKCLVGSPHPTPNYTHIAAPARPLDETKIGLWEGERPRRKGNILGGVMEWWMEGKAERRREDLKRIISVVPREEGGDGFGVEAVGLERRESAFGWM